STASARGLPDTWVGTTSTHSSREDDRQPAVILQPPPSRLPSSCRSWTHAQMSRSCLFHEEQGLLVVGRGAALVPWERGRPRPLRAAQGGRGRPRSQGTTAA